MAVPRGAAALVAVLSLAAAAVASEPDRQEAQRRQAAGACKFLRGVADAEADVLVAPELFGRFGGVNLVEAATDGTTVGSEKQRLMLGVSYSLGHLYQGITVRKRGDAECRRETARAGLEAARLRLDSLRALLTQTALERERLPPPAAQPSGQPALGELLQQFRAADDEVEQIAGRLRSSTAWDLSLRGAYDRVFDTRETTSPPLFGMVMVTYNLGGLFQPAANARAREGRRERDAEDLSGVDRRAAELLRQLKAIRSAEQTRVREVSVLAADLEQQLEQVRKLQTVRVRRFAEVLWFELTRLRAELAFLKVHLKDLAAVLGEGGQ